MQPPPPPSPPPPLPPTLKRLIFYALTPPSPCLPPHSASAVSLFFPPLLCVTQAAQLREYREYMTDELAGHGEKAGFFFDA